MRRVGAVLCVVAALEVLSVGGLRAQTHLERATERGQQLRVRAFAGRVVVAASGDDTLRVDADVESADDLVIEREGRTWSVVPADWARDAGAFALDLPDRVTVRVEGSAPRAVELRVTAPAWMPVVVESPRADVAIAGIEAPVEVTTFAGDVRVEGAASRVRIASLLGRVEVEGARGLVAVEGTGQPVVLRACEGDVRIEMTRGDVTLEGQRAGDVEVRSLAGTVRLRGRLTPLGHYRLSSHGGEVLLEVEEPVDATFEVRAFRGVFRSALVPAGAVEDGRGDFTLGDGGARVRLETFSGLVSVRAWTRE